MENKEDDIEHLFQERFANDEVPLSPRVWQNIKKTLPEDKGPTGFMFSSNMVLWSIAGIFMVSVVIGCFLVLTPKNNHTSIAVQKQKSVNKTDGYTTADADRNNRLNTTSVKHLPLDSLSNADVDAQTIQAPNQKNNNEDKNDNTSQESKSSKHIQTINTSRSHQKGASISMLNDKNASTVKSEKRHTSSRTDRSFVINNTNSKSRNHSTLAPNTNHILHKQKNKRDRLLTGKNGNAKTVSIANESAGSFDTLHTLSDKTVNKLGLTDLISSKTNTLTKSRVNQKSQDKKSILLNNDSSLAKTNAADESNASLSSSKSDFTKQNTTDSVSSSEDQSSSAFNRSSVIRSDSSLTNSFSTATPNILSFDSQKDSLKNTTDLMHQETLENNSVESNHSPVVSDSSLADGSSASLTSISSDHEKDRLKTASLLSPATNENDPSDSTALRNSSATDSLSSTISLATNNPITDSLALPLDSTQNIHKDSVLAEASTKNKKSKNNLLSRFTFDMIATALSTGASTKTTATDSLNQAAIRDKNQHDKNSLGYSAGIIVNYKLSDRIQASAGILYAVFSEQYNFNYSLKKFDWVYIDSNWQYIEQDSINRDTKAKDQYSFLSIPLQLSYTFIAKEKIRLSATAGIRSNILLKGVTYLSNATKSDVTGVRSGFNIVSFSYLLALEAEYKLNTHTALLLQPTFVYAASSVHNKASGIVQKPYGVGVTVGMRITF